MALFALLVSSANKPASLEECQVLMIEPAGTLNTGDAGGEKTIEKNAWI